MYFIERANDKYNKIWIYILVVFLSFIMGTVIGNVPLIITLILKFINEGSSALSGRSLDILYSLDKNLVLPLMLFPFVIILLFAVLLIRVLQKRSFSETINGRKKIRWSRVLWGYLLWGVFILIATFVEILFNPEDFTFQFNASKFIPLVFITLILIPFQTTCEEFIFRGYMVQGFGSKTKSRVLAILIPGILFGLLHSLNPEVGEYGFWATMPQYILFGLVFGVISVLDDGIELALGMHAVNNTLACLLVTSKASALQTDALYVIDTASVNPLKEALGLLLFCIFAVVFFARKYKWDFSLLLKKVEIKTDSIEL